jgi:RNA 3'-terminal phosphate cyclase (ATP)
LKLTGGTHNPFAPPYDFLASAYLPLINRMGPHVQAELIRPGFYPSGGGQIHVRVRPADRLVGFDLLQRGDIVGRHVRAMVANLPTHIAQRECQTIGRESGWADSCFEVRTVAGSRGPGNAVIVEVESTHVTEVFTGFGRRGVRAEKVAMDTWHQTQEYLAASVPVGRHLADQLLLPLAVAAHQGGSGSFRTMALSRHSTTHIEVLRRFLDVSINVDQTAPDIVLVQLTKG